MASSHFQFWQFMLGIKKIDQKFYQSISFFLDEYDSRGTIDQYITILTQFFKYYRYQKKEFPIAAQIDTTIIRQYFLDLKRSKEKDGGYKSSYLANIYSCLNSLFRFCVGEGIIEKNPMDRVRRPKRRESEPTDHLTIDETKKFLSAFYNSFQKAKENKSSKDKRDSLMRYVMVYCYLSVGMRSTELANLKLSDFYNFDDQPALKLKIKGGRIVLNPIPKSTAELIQYWINCYRHRADDKEYIFVYRHAKDLPLATGTILAFVKREAKRLGIKKKITTHTLKSSFLTRLHDQGASINQIRSAGNHSHHSTTLIYLKENRDNKALVAKNYDIADILDSDNL